MTERTVRVWDPLVRLFHWCLVVSFAVAWLTADAWDDIHEWAGYAAAALAVFRIIWGVVGSRYARFTQFVRGPAAVAAYAAACARRKERRYIGHNPAGAAMIVALILTLLGTALTGWMFTLDAFWGDAWVEEAHEALADVMLILVGLHIAGVIYASLRHRENLVRAMVTGRKATPSGTDIA